MTKFSQLFILAALCFSATSHAANARAQSNKGASGLSKSSDPMLMAGLGRNPAECPFKSPVGKNENTAGVIYGKSSTGTGSSASDTQNR
jgi:hypothetical protein